MKDKKAKTKIIYNVPIPNDDFPDWDFAIEEPKTKKQINIIIPKKKKHDRRGKSDTKLF